MIHRFVVLLAVALPLAGVALAQTQPAATARKPAAEPPYKPTAEELEKIRAKTDELAAMLKRLSTKKVDDGLLADVEIYGKAAVWITRYADEEFYNKRYVADALTALDRGLVRAKELATGRATWPKQKGQLVRAYRSRVDGSLQPYGLAIPASYKGIKPVRLDVVLHGRGGTLNEVSFIASHDADKPVPPDQDGIRLEVYGRGNNAYRWAGETDVFEAVNSVRERYKIDVHRVVLRGFSMGGAGAWHLGLHYPGPWAAVECGAGFTETKRYAKIEDLPAYQEPLLHIYDATDYSLNACNSPIIGYGGEDDAQLQGATNIREQLIKEGFHFKPDGLNWVPQDLPGLFLVGPKTGHKFHPDSKARSDQYINSVLAKNRPQPDHLRFVTYTTRYDRCFWLRVAGMEKHYQRAEVEARRTSGGAQIELTAKNVSRLVLTGQSGQPKLKVDGAEVALAARADRGATDLLLEKTPAGWTAQFAAREVWDNPLPLRKTHGRQGPIDDALAESFLCVRGTGTPQNAAAQQYAQQTLEQFSREFARWMRGDVRVKDDTAVTADDMAEHHLILFGDPGSNKVLGQIAEKLPIRWTAESIAVGGKKFAGAEHTLVMIYPNPLNPRRYVVLNSGHTFHEKDFRGTNALLYPRLGDYAVLRLEKGTGDTAETTVAAAGLFGENWELKQGE